jgi:predicted CXXCH cytochrome family protein
MSKKVFVVVLALALTFAFATSAYATTGKFYKGGVDYYTWLNPTGSPTPGTSWVASGLSALGANPTLPGPHANYLANTAKCGICHSVHRANGAGVKLLPTADATCAGCHTGSTAVTAKIITWANVNLDWVPTYTAGVLDESPLAGGGGGPHNDPVWDTVLPELIAANGGAPVFAYPAPSYALEPFSRYGCFTRRCHATNPHGANASQYTIFAQKLLFNDSPAQDDVTYPELVAVNGNGTYGGLDAAYDALGATDASVQRFIDANPLLVRATGATIELYDTNTLTWGAPDANETHALVAGLTCGRPSNPATGEDECHAEASYAIVDKGITESRNHATLITGNDGSDPLYPNLIQDPINGSNNVYRTDNTGVEAPGWGGNDSRDLKTGHVAGTFAAVNAAGSYTAIAGCTSCHDQTDAANTVAGNFTFPHGQTATGATNLVLTDGVTSATGTRSRIWSGWGGSATDVKRVTDATSKAFDGQCLKCHRDGAGNGIGQTH